MKKDHNLENEILEGETLFSEGKIEEAEKCFLRLLEKYRENAEILNNVGVIQFSRGNFEEAEAFFLKAIATEDDHQEAVLNLANLYENSKRWGEAARYLMVII